jgi:hypothetical protein
MEEIVIGFDFECAGGVPQKHGFTQLGASAHVLSTGEKISGFNQYASMDGFEWEDRCLREFWLKNPVRYKETLLGTTSAQETCWEVVALFNSWVRQVSAGRKCTMISDNMIYDGGLLKFFSTEDIMYLHGDMTVFFDTGSVYYGMQALHTGTGLSWATDQGSSKQGALKAVGAPGFPIFDVKHDHHPQNDAETMVRRWIYIQRCLTVKN